MKIKRIDEPKIIMSNPDGKFNYFGWPTAKRLKNGKIAVAASGFRRMHVCPFGKTVISFSENEGETYSLPAPVIDTPLDDRDGGLCPFGENGLIVTSFNSSLAFDREQNKRYTENRWDRQPELMFELIERYLDTTTPEEEEKYLGPDFKVSHDNGVTFGELKKAPVTSPHGPIELQDGTILWVGSVFNATDNQGRIQAYTINPDGSCEYVSTLPPIIENSEALPGCEPYTIQLSDGRLICHMRVDPQFTIFQSVSEDNGKTWSEPVRIFDDKFGAPSHILEHSSGVLICALSVREAPCGIRIVISRNKGETWEDCGYVYDDHAGFDLGYPSTVELDDGSLITVFYVRDTKVETPCVIKQQKWAFEK